MIVVTDTSPLNYLLLMERVEVLPKLYGRVLMPQAVLLELRAGGAPLMVREWAAELPTWVEVVEAAVHGAPSSARLGPGESEAITLALAYRADVLLMDDGAGRRVAIARGLRVTGTLGVLKDAADEGLLDFRQSVEQVRRFGFRMTDLLLAQILADITVKPDR